MRHLLLTTALLTAATPAIAQMPWQRGPAHFAPAPHFMAPASRFAPGYPPPHRGGPGWGAVAGAAVLGALVGAIMKASKGKADGKAVTALLQSKR